VVTRRYGHDASSTVTDELPPNTASQTLERSAGEFYKHLDQFKGNAKIMTWFTSIVTNSALTQLRRRSRHFDTSLDEPLALDQNSSISDRLVDERSSAEEEYATSELHEHLMQIVGEKIARHGRPLNDRLQQ
jgi:hypothetical protein